MSLQNTTLLTNELTFSFERFLPWIVVFSASLFFFYEFIQMNMFNAIDHELVTAFGLEASALGHLSAIYFYANILFLFPAGILLDRVSTKKIILVSMTFCIVGTLSFATSNSFWMAYLSRFFTGIGSAFCFLSCIRLASRWFPAHRMALVTGMIVTVAMLGGIVAQKPLLLVVEAVGWRHALLLDGFLGICILLLVAMFVVDRPISQRSETHQPLVQFWEQFKHSYCRRQNWCAACYTSLMNMPIGILGVVWGLPYLTTVHQLSRLDATDITSMIFLGTIVGGPTMGWISDKVGARKPLMAAGAIASLVVVGVLLNLPMASYWLLMFLFLALGFCTSTQILSYAAVAESNPVTNTAMATSVISFLTQGGIAVYQTVFGYIMTDHTSVGDMVGSAGYSVTGFHHALLMIPIGFVLALLFSRFLTEAPKSQI